MESCRVALISMHTSPTDRPGSGDAGGLNVHVRALADGLVTLGWEVEVLTRRTAPAQPEALRLATGPLIRFLAAGRPGPLAKEELPAVTDAFRDAVGRLPPFDVYHSHYWLSAEAALPVARRVGAPHIASLHTIAALKNRGLAPGQPREPLSRITAEGRLARTSSAIIAATNAEREALRTEYRVPDDRIRVIEPGVDTGLFRPRERPGPARSELLVVGRVQPLKRQDLAIRALSWIDPAHRPRLIVVGDASGPVDGYPGLLRRLVEERRLSDDVVFAGAASRGHLAERLSGARLVLIPSSSETYGLVALEAAASGVPVVATAVAGLNESVVDGVTGVLVPRIDDPVAEERAWASRITCLLEDRPRRDQLGSSALAHARARSWEATARKTAEVYKRARDGEVRGRRGQAG